MFLFDIQARMCVRVLNETESENMMLPVGGSLLFFVSCLVLRLFLLFMFLTFTFSVSLSIFTYSVTFLFLLLHFLFLCLFLLILFLIYSCFFPPGNKCLTVTDQNKLTIIVSLPRSITKKLLLKCNSRCFKII